MAVTPSPFGPKPQFVDSSGSPDLSYKVFFYAAGSNTKQNTYTDSTGASANANPIILNSLGQPTNEIWFTVGQFYKVVLAPSTDTDPPTSPIWTVDNVQGMGTVTTSTTLDEWVLYSQTPTFISATSFSVAGNQTATFQAGRRVKTTNTGGVVYSTIASSVFGAVTTVTVVNDSGSLDVGLSAVSYGLLSVTNPSIPETTIGKTLRTAATAAAALAVLPIQSGTKQATTSGTAIDFTGIPSWVKKVTLNLSGVSTTGTSNPIIQIGAGSITAAGYVGGGTNVGNAVATTATSFTTGFGIVSGAAANVLHGAIVVTLLDSATGTWCCSGNVGSSTFVCSTGGSVSLAGTLDRLRLTTVGGVDTFDAGSVNILFE